MTWRRCGRCPAPIGRSGRWARSGGARSCVALGRLLPSSESGGNPTATPSPKSDALIASAAFILAGVAAWITAHADFLSHPGWLALQKADLILGPVLVGLYWR